TKEFVNLPQIISEQVSSLRGEVRRKRIRLVVSLPEGDVRFWADAGDVTQIFLNLLSNAVKFTPAGGRVELRVLRRPKELVIQVTDTGVGIAKEDLPKIFREFYYVNHPEVGATLGSGLGLSIVKRVIEAYRGRILVTSRVGHGTQFRLTLPVMAERGYMNEFLKEVWSEAKRADWAIGFLFCQMRSSGRDGSFPPRDLPRAVHELEKKLHTYFLKREDRIFHLPANSLLVVLVRTDPEDFPVTVRRLQRALEEGWAIQKFKGRGIQWRLAALRVPRMGGSPGRFLEMGRRRLRESWTKAVPV
ncbi:MAG: ATP-binding protein, partial [Candidatus Omnitrophica bacterium]|nr:ATP-binding protein [Candidatus Omnitrophota bacterium]